jgi:hypothetical protein
MMSWGERVQAWLPGAAASSNAAAAIKPLMQMLLILAIAVDAGHDDSPGRLQRMRTVSSGS